MTAKLDFLLLAQLLEKFNITRVRVRNADIHVTSVIIPFPLQGISVHSSTLD